MIRGILFDLDNTLLDFMRMKEVSIDAAVMAMIDNGMPVPHKEAKGEIYKLYDQVGIEHSEIFQLYLQHKFETIDYKWLAAGVVAYRRARDASLVTYPHVRQTLIEFGKRGLKLAVISDAPRLGAWLRLCHLDLQHLFEVVVTYEDTGHRKPSPMPFERALSKMNMKPHQVIMIGDWPERDMVGAKRLGIRTVFARYGDTKNTTESGADFEIDDISQLLTVLETIQLNDRQSNLFSEGE